MINTIQKQTREQIDLKKKEKVKVQLYTCTTHKGANGSSKCSKRPEYPHDFSFLVSITLK